jgi:hypothetical protein
MKVYAERITLADGRLRPSGPRWSQWTPVTGECPGSQVLLRELIGILPRLRCTGVPTEWARYTGTSGRTTAVALVTVTGDLAIIARCVITNIPGLSRRERTTLAYVTTDANLPLNREPDIPGGERWGAVLEEGHVSMLEPVAFVKRDGELSEAFAIPTREGHIPVVFRAKAGSKVYLTVRDRVHFLRDSCWINQTPSSGGSSSSAGPGMVPDDPSLN